MATWLLTPVVQPATADDLDDQAWANLTIALPQREKLYFEVDLEAKALVSGEPGWQSLAVTPAIEYYPSPWIDLIGAAIIGSTRQTDDLRTTEATARAGARFHLFKAALHKSRIPVDRLPVNRFSLGSLLRLEARNFWYSDGRTPEHSARFRIRLESRISINKPNLTADRTFYALADAEWFVPVGGEVEERFVNRYRVRVGLGYRLNSRHRVDLLYIRDWVRPTVEERRRDNFQALDLRYRVVL